MQLKRINSDEFLQTFWRISISRLLIAGLSYFSIRAKSYNNVQDKFRLYEVKVNKKSNAIDKFGTLQIKPAPTGDLTANGPYQRQIICLWTTELCPGSFKASNGERESFWALFIASIARFESRFDPNSRMQENASLGYIYSEGLLQLSYGDEKTYGHCKLNGAAGNILDPKINLQCGVAILSVQVAKRRVLFPNQFFYWSVLSIKKSQIRINLLNTAAQLPFCKGI